MRPAHPFASLNWIFAASLMTACAGRGGGDTDSTARTVIVDAAQRSGDETIAAVNRQAINAPDDLRAEALDHLNDESAEVHRAALYALSVAVQPDDSDAVDALRVALAAPDEIERLTAAGGLLSIGEKDAVPALIDMLASETMIPYSDPPRSTWRTARALLLTHTDQDLGLMSAREVAAARRAQAAWHAWWAASGSTLTWDEKADRFTH